MERKENAPLPAVLRVVGFLCCVVSQVIVLIKMIPKVDLWSHFQHEVDTTFFSIATGLFLIWILAAFFRRAPNSFRNIPLFVHLNLIERLTAWISMILLANIVGYIIYAQSFPGGQLFFTFPLLSFLVVAAVIASLISKMPEKIAKVAKFVGRTFLPGLSPTITFGEVIFVDILTSLTLPLFDFNYSMCFFISGEFLVGSERLDAADEQFCGEGSTYYTISRLLIFLFPYILRFVQCIVRFSTDAKVSNLLNAGKYLTSICVVLASFVLHHYTWVAYGVNGMVFVMWCFFATVKTFYCFFWDVAMDWGWYTVTTKRRAYFIYSNLLMRCSWTIGLTINGLALIGLDPVWAPLMALIEIWRRAQWLLLRLERHAQDNESETAEIL